MVFRNRTRIIQLIAFFLFVGLLGSISAALAVTKEGTLLVTINFVGNNYFVSNARQIPQTLPLNEEQAALQDDFIVKLYNPAQQLVALRRIRNPRLSHSALHKDDADVSGQAFHHHAEALHGSFMLRLPTSLEVVSIEVEEPITEISSSRKSVSTKSLRTPNILDVSRFYK
ncbi:MAG: hypothetical protein OEZ47_10405 [Gammaproteobacteria bacterium]|nr:hypothetical protein [Gammaproteobacteria bacterium]